MLRILILLIALGFGGMAANVAGARVLVIGIDGGSWNVIDPMIAAGELPNLKALIANGGSANLATVEPVTSPVVWTSIATGRTPEIHGITDFFSTRATIAVPTIYERLAAEGFRVGLYDVLMTWPPVPLPGGFVIPSWLRRDETTWPRDALEPPSIFRTDYKNKTRNRDYIVQGQGEAARKAASWKQLSERFDPQVGALTFYAVDATSHRYWHGAFPEEFDEEMPAIAQDEREAIRQSLRGIDGSIGEIVSDLDLDQDDHVLVVSDHGFKAAYERNIVWTTRFEDLLATSDLDPERDQFKVVSTFFAVTIRIAPGPFEERDRLIEKLKALLDSYRTPDGEALMRTNVLDVAERPSEMRRSIFERARQWTVKRFMNWAFSTKIDPTAHAMLIALPKSDAFGERWPDGEIEVGGQLIPVHQAMIRQRFTGTHDETAIFIAAGASIKKQPKRGELSVLQIAPLVAYLAGAPIPDDLDGSLPTDWIEPSFAANNPARERAAEDWPELADVPTPAGANDSGGQDLELIERLRALGYIE